MAARISATGTIAEPKLEYGQDGKARLKIRLNATARRKDRQTGEWADWGDQLWYSATFWDKRAEELMKMLRRGDMVTVEGTQVLHTYQKQDGTMGTDLEIGYPEWKGLVRRSRQSQGDQWVGSGSQTHGMAPRSDAQAPGAQGWGPAQNGPQNAAQQSDPWSGQQQQFPDSPPF